jgi:hypothetical protein
MSKQVAFADRGSIAFPSFTICKKYVFDESTGIIEQIKNPKKKRGGFGSRSIPGPEQELSPS